MDKEWKKFQREFLGLKCELEDDPHNQELRAKAEALANETGITFWFVEDVSGYWDDHQTEWAVFIPKNIDEEKIQQYYDCDDHNLLRPFIDGESAGKARGEWVSSYSC
jgi:hypothetical protein